MSFYSAIWNQSPHFPVIFLCFSLMGDFSRLGALRVICNFRLELCLEQHPSGRGGEQLGVGEVA